MKLVAVSTFPDAILAEMYAELLRRQGVPVMVQPVGAHLGGWAVGVASMHRLLVPEDYFDRANRILLEYLAGDEES